MIDLFLAFLNFLGSIDSEARIDGPSTWPRRHRKLIRVALIICSTPVCAGLLILFVQWLSSLSPVAQRVTIGVGAIQLIGFFVLLIRRHKA